MGSRDQGDHAEREKQHRVTFFQEARAVAARCGLANRERIVEMRKRLPCDTPARLQPRSTPAGIGRSLDFDGTPRGAEQGRSKRAMDVRRKHRRLPV
jgi:hypothetical protein